MSKYTTDRDGKSKTASAVDGESYPEQHQVKNHDSATGGFPSLEQISLRAYQLWRERGCQNGSADEDWLQAERELRAAEESRNVLAATARLGGSVQR